ARRHRFQAKLRSWPPKPNGSLRRLLKPLVAGSSSLLPGALTLQRSERLAPIAPGVGPLREPAHARLAVDSLVADPRADDDSGTIAIEDGDRFREEVDGRDQDHEGERVGSHQVTPGAFLSPSHHDESRRRHVSRNSWPSLSDRPGSDPAATN